MLDGGGGSGESGEDGMDEGEEDGETTEDGMSTDSGSDGSEDGEPPPDDGCAGLFEVDEDASVPKLIGPDQPGVYAFAQTPDYLLWVSDSNREMVRLSKCDAETTVLYDSVHVGRHVAVAGDRAVGHGRQKGGNIFSLPLAGGIAIAVHEKLPPYEVVSLDSDADFAYWIDIGDGLAVRRAPHLYGEEELLVELDELTGTLRLGEDRVFFSDGSAIKSVHEAGGAADLLVELDAAVPSRVSVDGSHVYASAQPLNDEGYVFRVPIDGGPIEVLVDGLDGPGQLTIDDAYVYWVQPEKGLLVRVPKSGGVVEPIVQQQHVPEALAVDADYLFWSNLGDAGVWVRALD
jgi:hypothetical protein